MKIRLAKKVKKYRSRYSLGKWHAALTRLGYKRFTWRTEIRLAAR